MNLCRRAVPGDSTAASMLESENEFGRTCAEQNLLVQQKRQGMDSAERKLKSDNKKETLSYHPATFSKNVRGNTVGTDFISANLHLEI